MSKCRCNPISTPFEFEINDNNNSFARDFGRLFPIQKDIDKLKNKIICEYNEILNKLECGIQEDLESILQDISYVYIKEKICQDKTIYIPPTTYIGFDTENDMNKINLNSLLKRYSSKIETVETIKNEVYGSYLWIISPHTLEKVAVDEGFTYEVKMNFVGFKNEMYYYRSNSKIDICNLTYYIK